MAAIERVFYQKLMGLRLRMRSVTAWTRASARSGEWGGAEVGRPGTHLVFELWEAADVMDSSLLIQRGDGLGPDLLAVSGADGLDGQGALYRVPQRGLDMVSSGVGLDDYLGGVELVEEVGDSQSHVVGGEPAGLVGQDVGVLAAHVGSDDDYAGLGACGTGGHGGVYGDDDAGDGRVAPEPGFLYPLAFPEGVFVFVGDLGVYLLLSYAGAVVAVVLSR